MEFVEFLEFLVRVADKVPLDKIEIKVKKSKERIIKDEADESIHLKLNWLLGRLFV